MSAARNDTSRPARKASNGRQRAGRSKSTHGKKKGSSRGLGFLHLFSRYFWLWLLGALLIAAAYVCFFYVTFVTPFSFRWRAIYGESPLPEGYEVCGIDISHYQEHINWERLRNASIGDTPIRFVFIKATEGEKLMDDYFNENFFLSRENDFVRGAYHFFVPDVDPRRQAEFFLRQVHLVPGDLPPVLDVEKAGKLTKQQLRHDVKVWLDLVEKKYGVKPILYTGYKFKLEYLDTPEFADYPFWIAHYYVRELTYKGKWAFWQHTDCGKVKGIKGLVDCNIFNGTQEDLMALTIQEQEE